MNNITKKYIHNILLAKRQDLNAIEELIAKLENSLAKEEIKRDELIREIDVLEKDLNN